MASFCQAGDTARVTFPDGSVEDFTDTPINIECIESYPECTAVNVSITCVDGHGVVLNHTGIAFAPIGGVRPRSWSVELLSRGTPFSGCISYGWRGFYNNFGRNGGFISASITNITPRNSSTQPTRRITVVGNSGETLFSGNFASCDYSVDCISCPPNTLDCGDCCLPCSDIFNQLSSALSQIARLK